jgi:hypothetical protein
MLGDIIALLMLCDIFALLMLGGIIALLMLGWHDCVPNINNAMMSS